MKYQWSEATKGELAVILDINDVCLVQHLCCRSHQESRRHTVQGKPVVMSGGHRCCPKKRVEIKYSRNLSIQVVSKLLHANKEVIRLQWANEFSTGSPAVNLTKIHNYQRTTARNSGSHPHTYVLRICRLSQSSICTVNTCTFRTRGILTYAQASPVSECKSQVVLCTSQVYMPKLYMHKPSVTCPSQFVHAQTTFCINMPVFVHTLNLPNSPVKPSTTPHSTIYNTPSCS